MRGLVVVLLQLRVLWVASTSSPRIEITFPPQHSSWQVSNSDGLLSTLHIYFKPHGFRVPEDGFVLVTGDNVPEGGYQHLSRSRSIVIRKVDPGSFFWTLELMPWNRSVALAQAKLHIEVVVDVSDTHSPWIYTLREHEKRPTGLVNKQLSSVNGSVQEQALPVCYITSVAGAFDGQKRMWLQSMKGLGDTRRFEFAVKTFEDAVDDGPFAHALQNLNVSAQGLPLTIYLAELSDGQASSECAAEALLASFYRRFPAAKELSGVISKLDQSALAQLQPPFAARIWTRLVDVLRSPCADGLVVFSNSRTISDQLVVLAARLVGARAVIMELANLHPPPVDVDVLLAPSHFALHHYSVAANVRAQHTVVLSTGVDTQLFAPPMEKSNDQQFVIGYVGRLTTEKSLGILLAAMKLLAPACPHCRLRIIGDGLQKPWLQSLAREWGLLNSSVEFVDGIYNDGPALVQALREMHVFASPLFTETLGLAVLEAMSVGLPVVGFISGGTGEFLKEDVNCVAIKKATPESFAASILSVVYDNEKRLRLGRNARRTVEERFSTHAALEQYANLYERAGHPMREYVSKDKAAPFSFEESVL